MNIGTSPVTATCNGCGERMTGRTDRRYCSNACRQRAYRNSQPEVEKQSFEVMVANGINDACRTLTMPSTMEQLSPFVKRYVVETLRDAADVLEAHLSL